MKRSNGSQEEAPVRVQIPWRLNQAIVRIQAKHNLTFEEAGLRAATLLEPGEEDYGKQVLDEANALAKSRYMIQLNKARKTIEDVPRRRGHDVGYKEGVLVGYNKGLQQFTYLCKDCRQVIQGSQEQWIWLVKNGYLSTWTHPNCPGRLIEHSA